MSAVQRPGPPLEEPRASLSLLDYRRRVAELYAEIRSLPPPDAHPRWMAGRDELFRSHPQSPIPAGRRASFTGLTAWPYQPALRFEAVVEPAAGQPIDVPHSGSGTTRAAPWGVVSLVIAGVQCSLTLYRLDQYGEGVFVPFRDETSGGETYGGGRYLIDTAKGADLGSSAGSIVIDFNFAYHPSCVHDDQWSCPLAPPQNRLAVPIRAGERLPG